MSQNGFRVFLKSHTKFYGFFPNIIGQEYGARGLKVCDCKTHIGRLPILILVGALCSAPPT